MDKSLSFREYYEKNLVIESPHFSGIYMPQEMDYWPSNKEWTKDTLKITKEIDKFTYFDLVVYVYYRNTVNTECYHFVDHNKEYMKAEYFCKANKYGMVCVRMWKWRDTILKMNWLILNYFLPKQKWIFSDIDLTDKGIQFWQNFIKENINNKKYEFGIYNILKDKLVKYEDYNNFDGIWENYANTQVWIKEK